MHLITHPLNTLYQSTHPILSIHPQEAEGKARCCFKYCSKLFRGVDFLRKHLQTKHETFAYDLLLKDADPFMRSRYESEDIQARPLPPIECEAPGGIDRRSVGEILDKGRGKLSMMGGPMAIGPFAGASVPLGMMGHHGGGPGDYLPFDGHRGPGGLGGRGGGRGGGRRGDDAHLGGPGHGHGHGGRGGLAIPLARGSSGSGSGGGGGGHDPSRRPGSDHHPHHQREALTLPGSSRGRDDRDRRGAHGGSGGNNLPGGNGSGNQPNRNASSGGVDGGGGQGLASGEKRSLSMYMDVDAPTVSHTPSPLTSSSPFPSLSPQY